MKIHIDSDEWYPMYSISSDTTDTAVEVHVSTVKRWRRVLKEFKAVQEEMGDALDKAEGYVQ